MLIQPSLKHSLLFATCFLSVICCNPKGKPGHREQKSTKSPVAKVSAVRSPVWLAHSLYTQNAAGEKRDIAPGGEVGLGESLHTGKSLKVALDLNAHGTAELEENTSLSFEKVGESAGLAFLQGKALITRPMGHETPLDIRVGKTHFKMDYGRLFLSKNDSREKVTVVRVDAGEISLAKKGTRLSPGKVLTISDTKEASGDEPAQIGKKIPLPPLPDPLVPMTPESIRIPTRSEVLRGIGTLTARAPGSGRTSENALDLVKHLVKVTIRDGVALTEVSESFTNHSNRTVEGTYRFMLPGDASITRLALDVNGRIEEGEVLEKKRARRIFKKIVDDSVRPRDPALLEWERGSSFSMRIFPIKGKETRTVYISYMEPLALRDGMYQYTYPLGGPAGAPEVGHFEIETDVAVELGVGEIRTPLYESAIEVGDKKVTSHFKAEKYTPTSDYILQFTPLKAPPEMRVASQTDKDGTTYAMALLNPNLTLEEQDTFARTVIILDTSYGMGPDILSLAQATILELLSSARRRDAFTILACDSGCRALSSDFLNPSEENLQKTQTFLSALEPGGASDILGAMAAGFSLMEDGSPGTVLYFGDGVPTAGEVNLKDLRNILVDLKPESIAVHTIGMGPSMDTLALTSLANHLGGTSHLVNAGETPIVAAASINRLLRSNLLRDVTITWPNGVETAYPNLLGAIPLGQELPVTAKLTGKELEGDIIFRGRTALGNTVERRYPIHISAGLPSPGFIGRLFAKSHIDHLTLEPDSDREIVRLSTKMRVASRLTSWIVLENQRMYNEFNVKRTDAEMWQGEQADFQAVKSDDDFEDEALLEEAEEPSADRLAIGTPGASAKSTMGTMGASAKRKKAAPAMARKAESRTMESESMPDMRNREIISDDFITPPAIARPPSFTVSIKRPAPPSNAERRRLETLKNEVTKFPLKRSIHLRLLRLLARLNQVDEAVRAAEEWRKIDPLGTSALRSYGDAVARTGDRNRAMRIYSSLAELNPGSKKIHMRLAEAFEDLGLFDAAASHYRAAASAKGGKPTAMIQYLSCLIGAKKMSLYELEKKRIKENPSFRAVHQMLDTLSSRTTADPGLLYSSRRQPRGDLRIQMNIEGAHVDLDVSVIDPSGRRISGIWRRGASTNFLISPSNENLFVHSLQKGSYNILVSRTEVGQAEQIAGKLQIKAKNKRQTIPFTLVGNEVHVATVKYQRNIIPYRHYR